MIPTCVRNRQRGIREELRSAAQAAAGMDARARSTTARAGVVDSPVDRYLQQLRADPETINSPRSKRTIPLRGVHIQAQAGSDP